MYQFIGIPDPKSVRILVVIRILRVDQWPGMVMMILWTPCLWNWPLAQKWLDFMAGQPYTGFMKAIGFPEYGRLLNPFFWWVVVPQIFNFSPLGLGDDPIWRASILFKWVGKNRPYEGRPMVHRPCYFSGVSRGPGEWGRLTSHTQKSKLWAWEGWDFRNLKNRRILVVTRAETLWVKPSYWWELVLWAHGKMEGRSPCNCWWILRNNQIFAITTSKKRNGT